MMQRIVQNDTLALFLVALPWGMTGIQLVALTLSLLPVYDGFWLPSDPLMRVATMVPWGRLYLALGAVLCFFIGGIFAYYRERFEERRRFVRC
ncbi:MAG: hypothetical protein Q8R35_00680 [bacterium]|nr:hypothetical protein [bacterium]